MHTVPDPVCMWEIRFSQAKNHDCAYKDKCPVFAKTVAKQQLAPVQLQLNFQTGDYTNYDI